MNTIAPESKFDELNLTPGAIKKGRETLSTKEVLERHLKSFGDGDLDGLLSDYATNSVLFLPNGPLKEPDAISRFFRALFAEFEKPGATFSLNQQSVDGDYAYILWSAETADNLFELGMDTFVVRNGKIVAQSFAGKITPKA
jgi:ketosteroid isomerase-like protein